MMKPQASTVLVRLVCVLLTLGISYRVHAEDAGSTGGKTFIDYFRPTPIIGTLSKSAWGVQTVGARDQQNGLEDPTLAQLELLGMAASSRRRMGNIISLAVAGINRTVMVAGATPKRSTP